MIRKLHFISVILFGIVAYQLELPYGWVLGSAFISSLIFCRPEDQLKNLMATGLLSGGFLWLGLTWVNFERHSAAESTILKTLTTSVLPLYVVVPLLFIAGGVPIAFVLAGGNEIHRAFQAKRRTSSNLMRYRRNS